MAQRYKELPKQVVPAGLVSNLVTGPLVLPAGSPLRGVCQPFSASADCAGTTREPMSQRSVPAPLVRII
ncbi:MAG: hypothetical protein P0Y53_11260 [Candidatus Pseudobacter hemicellulosilyticus]|uniref:Uncharacterized protein n=1 Tax=Candidatus Pseudobacter hemicellulosilyticus TaxID=3121375 RepID=A0AAJ6BK58_9BACT|nr:MAG: hypothetical protein P0Y53_11260 [Pseudobacter sp.]